MVGITVSKNTTVIYHLFMRPVNPVFHFSCTASHPNDDVASKFPPVEGREEAARGEHERPPRQESPPVVHPVQISPRHVSHADGSGRAVQELVTVPEEGRYLLMIAIFHITGVTSPFFIFIVGHRNSDQG